MVRPRLKIYIEAGVKEMSIELRDKSEESLRLLDDAIQYLMKIKRE